MVPRHLPSVPLPDCFASALFIERFATARGGWLATTEWGSDHRERKGVWPYAPTVDTLYPRTFDVNQENEPRVCHAGVRRRRAKHLRDGLGKLGPRHPEILQSLRSFQNDRTASTAAANQDSGFPIKSGIGSARAWHAMPWR